MKSPSQALLGFLHVMYYVRSRPTYLYLASRVLVARLRVEVRSLQTQRAVDVRTVGIPT